MNQVYLILGSNINPDWNIPQAVKRLSLQPGITLVGYSSIWKTRPVGTSSNDFYNLAAHISTPLSAADLKHNALRVIETELGRVRISDKYAARTIDLDIVIFNDEIIDPNLFKYDYLILPLSELLPGLVDKTCDLTLKKLASTISPFSTAKKIEIPD